MNGPRWHRAATTFVYNSFHVIKSMRPENKANQDTSICKFDCHYKLCVTWLTVTVCNWVHFYSQKAASPHPVGPVVSEDDSSKGNLGFIHAFVASISVIIVSELGDKTFFIAAIMAMRYNRLTVLAGAMLALGLMTCLSG